MQCNARQAPDDMNQSSGNVEVDAAAGGSRAASVLDVANQQRFDITQETAPISAPTDGGLPDSNKR